MEISIPSLDPLHELDYFWSNLFHFFPTLMVSHIVYTVNLTFRLGIDDDAPEGVLQTDLPDGVPEVLDSDIDRKLLLAMAWSQTTARGPARIGLACNQTE